MAENNNLISVPEEIINYEPLETQVVRFQRKPESLVFLKDVYYNLKSIVDSSPADILEQINFPSLSIFYFLVEAIFLGHQHSKPKFDRTLEHRRNNVTIFAHKILPIDAIRVMISLYPPYVKNVRILYYVHKIDEIAIFHDQTPLHYVTDALTADIEFNHIRRAIPSIRFSHFNI